MSDRGTEMGLNCQGHSNEASTVYTFSEVDFGYDKSSCVLMYAWDARGGR